MSTATMAPAFPDEPEDTSRAIEELIRRSMPSTPDARAAGSVRLMDPREAVPMLQDAVARAAVASE